MAHTTALYFAGFLVMILASRGQGMSLRMPGDDPEGTTKKIRIDPPVLNVRKPCLKQTMDGETIEKRQCPTDYTCTRGPKEIVMNGDDLKVWFCEQGSNLQQETPEPLDTERPLGDGPKVTEPVVDEITTPVPEKRLPSWFRSACRVEEQYGAIIKKSACEDGHVCSRSFQYYLLAQEYVKVSFCVQKTPKKILPSGLPDWLLCYIAQKYTGGRMTGELPWVNEDGTVPVLNC